MANEVFYCHIANKVTDVGLRLAIAKEVPDELSIRVDNLADNKVVVYLKGNKVSAEKFYDTLKTKKLGDAKDYRFSEFKPIESTKSPEVDTDRFYHKLQSEQLGKFVEIGLAMGGNIEKMAGSVKGMDESMGEMAGNIGGMNKVVGGLDNKYHNISKTLNYQLIGISILIVLALIFGIFLVLK